jgi:methionyl-tRNA formyltransferase
LRTVFLGTSEFAVEVLRRLAASTHRPELVLTRPDRPRGRGRHPAPPPVAVAARELAIEVDQPESVNDEATRDRLAELAPEAVIVCAFGALIKEPLLSEHLMLNVHPSLLPRWRGAAPVERAIMAGDEETGVSIMRVSAGLDSGPVCAQEREPITPQDDYGSLAGRLAEVGGELLVRTLGERLDCRPQEPSGVTYAEKITPEDRQLDPSAPAQTLERIVRALNPHIGAWVELSDGSRLGVAEARAREGDAPPGRLVAEGPNAPTIGCGEGELQLVVVKPPGRRKMSAQDWLRGRRG